MVIFRSIIFLFCNNFGVPVPYACQASVYCSCNFHISYAFFLINTRNQNFLHNEKLVHNSFLQMTTKDTLTALFYAFLWNNCVCECESITAQYYYYVLCIYFIIWTEMVLYYHKNVRNEIKGENHKRIKMRSFYYIQNKCATYKKYL